MKTMTIAEYLAALKAQGVPRDHIASKCVACGTVQSPAMLIAARAGKTFDDVETYFGFSCVGRFLRSGPFTEQSTPGRGCDWTLGGFLPIHTLEVVTEDGERHPRFEPATAEEAVALMESLEQVST